MTVAPVAPVAAVAALRETSVVFAAAMGTLILKELLGRWRLAAVAGGAMLRSWGHETAAGGPPRNLCNNRSLTYPDMRAADDLTIFLCDQIGDRVRAILSTLPVSHEPQLPPIAGHRLLYCSGASLCGWSGPAPRRPNPCAHQRACVPREADWFSPDPASRGTSPPATRSRDASVPSTP